MKISKKYKQSVLSKVVDLLFRPKIVFDLENTKSFKLPSKLNYPKISSILLSLSVITFFFEGFFVKTMSFDISFLIPILLTGSLLLSDKKKILAHKSLIWYLSFLLVAVISSIIALSFSISPKLLLLGFLLYTQFGFAIMIGQTLDLKKVISGLSLLGLPIALVGIYQFVFKVQTSSLWVSPVETGIATRAFAFFGSPNVFGILMAIISLLAIGLTISKRIWQFGFLSSIFLIAMVFSFSRTAWIGCGVGLVLMLLFINWRFIFLGFFAPLMLLVTQVRTRILTIFSSEYAIDSSLDGRLWAINNGFHIFKQNPILGTGPGTYGGQLSANYSSPIYHFGLQNGYIALYFTDNQWLEILVQTGILGIMTFFGFVISTIWALIANFLKKRNWLVLSALSGLVCFLVCGLGANVLEFGAIAVPMGLILGSALNES